MQRHSLSRVGPFCVGPLAHLFVREINGLRALLSTMGRFWLKRQPPLYVKALKKITGIFGGWAKG